MSNTIYFRWRLWWIGHRNRILSSARFQNFAARFPFTKPIARKRARALFDLVAGFTYSQILAACIETGLFEILADAPLDARSIAQGVGIPIDGTERLLRAAAALGLVEPVGDSWALGMGGATILGNPGIAEMVRHHRLLYTDLTDPVRLLKKGGGGGALARLWHYGDVKGTNDMAAVSAYSALMSASQPMVAAQAIDAYPFGNHRRLLDVGGGEGTFLKAVSARCPQLHLGLFDLPRVAARAKEQLEQAGLGERSTVISGNFLTDPLPSGFDLISLIRVLHDHDDEPAMRLLKKIREALPVGGTLFISEPMACTPNAEPAGDAYFGFYLLAMGSGRPRSATETMAMLRRADFTDVRQISTRLPLTASAIVARR